MSKRGKIQLLDPKNDYVFKRLFVTFPDLLPALINAFRVQEQPIEIVEILNPRIDPKELTGKFIVLDVLAREPDGKQFNIEMQVRRYPFWGSRSTYYLARMLGDQLVSGHNYHLLKPVIGIHLLDFDLFTEEHQQNQAVWRFEMRDEWQPKVKLSQELQLNLIELRKADRLGLPTDNLRAWVTFFEHWHEEDTMANIHYEPVQKALTCIKTLSADAETKRLAFVRERALSDEATIRQFEREEGRIEGLIQGKIEGLEEAVIRLIKSGMSEKEARRLLNIKDQNTTGNFEH